MARATPAEAEQTSAEVPSPAVVEVEQPPEESPSPAVGEVEQPTDTGTAPEDEKSPAPGVHRVPASTYDWATPIKDERPGDTLRRFLAEAIMLQDAITHSRSREAAINTTRAVLSEILPPGDDLSEQLSFVDGWLQTAKLKTRELEDEHAYLCTRTLDLDRGTRTAGAGGAGGINRDDALRIMRPPSKHAARDAIALGTLRRAAILELQAAKLLPADYPVPAGKKRK